MGNYRIVLGKKLNSNELFLQDAPANEVLGFFENIRASVDNRLIELLSMNSLKDGTVECFVASRENDLFLPKEDTIDHLDSMTIDLPGIYVFTIFKVESKAKLFLEAMFFVIILLT